ncbi:DEAD/DEAH box helicase [Micromonospora harpali]|uniref:DEAD/DEAH box helicase n=3 Tax=Micromonospora TaxID=1873 RepID=A0ABW1HES3_9ACTN
MFNRGINALLAALPTIADLTVDEIRRILTTAWLETTGPRLGADQPATASAETLRRLATALELHAILPLQAEQLMVQACAFVAAEALTIAHDLADADETDEQGGTSNGFRFWLFGSERTFERVEAALLYLIAGYDANAALTVSGIGAEELGADSPEGPIASWAVQRIVGLCRLTPAAEVAAPTLDQQAHPTRILIRHELWRRIGVHVADHLDWLMFRTGADPNAGSALRALAERLENRDQVPARPAAHPDLYHLLLLLAAACDETGFRALRTVPPPPQDTGDRFAAYQRDRAATRPLLWPAAQEYAQATLPGPEAHAVVAVPTNSGKSSVAELAISQALCRGWVLYLAPTNALVGQIRRQVADVFGRATVREFLGGAEYTQLIGESLGQIEDRQVLVMTPEKCSLALRQNPEAFQELALCVFDEAHLLGDRASRGVIAELVVAEILHRARQARLLLMSALIANPSELGAWLSRATGTPTVVINEPWRPTRTLRVIAGIDRDRGIAAANAAYQQLQALPPRRVQQKFNTPIALLAGLQGAWTSQAVNDYALVQTDIEVPVAVTRDARWDPAGYCTPATAAIVQRLGLRGDRILAFLPRSKHDSFHAAGMTQFAVVPNDSTVEALLHLAELELGAPSALRAHLRRGVAVHTSALLREEQRASEISFERGLAVAMYATGTMAQGLNLPATAVVIGGTEIGYDNASTVQQRRDQTRAQLLNAIGRAGRAHVAPRSMAIVVPNKAFVLSSSADAQRAVRNAEFLQDEDASSELSSALDGLIHDVLSGALTAEDMTAAEHTAFSFLAFEDSEEDDTTQVVGKTWAVHRAGAQHHVSEITNAITVTGNAFIQSAGAPAWAAFAAHQSGIALPETATLYRYLRAYLERTSAPSTITRWADLMLDFLEQLPPAQLRRILPPSPYGDASKLSKIFDTGTPRTDAWSAYRAALHAWMNGEPIIAIAHHIHRKSVDGNAKRGPQDPLPRAITVTGNAFRFGLSLIAGALTAIITLGQEHEPDGPWALPAEAVRALNLLPLAVRSGADTPEALAWIRAGVHTRVAAHLLDDLLPAPPGQSDDDLRRWAHGRLMELYDDALPGLGTAAQAAVISALRIVREAR